MAAERTRSNRSTSTLTDHGMEHETDAGEQYAGMLRHTRQIQREQAPAEEADDGPHDE